MKINRNFAKLKADGTLEYAPIPLTVVTHHHEEWDEPVLDPETGLPVIDPETGEEKTERKSRDWDTSKTKIQPTADDYRQMNYLPVVDKSPSTPAPEGYHYEARGWQEQDDTIVRVYELVSDPLPTLAEYDEAMESHLRTEREERGYTTREPDAYLTSEVPRWAQDAKDWVQHRDAVMEYALDLINAVKSGEREPPTMEEFVTGLPQIQWTFAEAE